MNPYKVHWRSVFDQLAQGNSPEHEMVGVRSPANAEFIRRNVQAVIGDVRNLRILDAGSGEAQISTRYFASNQVVCLDFSVAVLRRIAPKSMGRLSGDLEHLPFATGSFDFVICIETLQCLPEVDNVLAEFARILKPGGRLVVSTLNAHSVLRRMLRLVRQPTTATILRSPFAIAKSLRRHGFEPTSIRYLTHYLHRIAAGRPEATLGGYVHSIAATNFIVDARKQMAS